MRRVHQPCGRGEIGKRKGLKIPRPYGLAGSSPAARTNFQLSGNAVVAGCFKLGNQVDLCPAFWNLLESGGADD